ncbi:2Fe-2S iron-sulfur cluster binding domain-containing protein [Neptuniibacter sp. CAU 1671]|uniref:2Fe-2S iron-sulfur cluster binding domain-containing protein n=1 Tax=Neptuniibacter sp. CAU 1671 TaxID=3032593 RepID=UPI0023DB99A3|nr:2Fe-2S iron-sulfur cluster binding domain-containing protein [Neptuniibacter sp. CAU 1671]MDF2180535.1 2Fe-2S iron-sulfur cluster binding domain-containing protein [Neptuniibacter sp. CAU 1671]
MKHLIEIVDTDESFLCDEAQSVLDGMFRLGRRGIPSGCRGGACGVCKVEVLDGEYQPLAMSRCHVNEDDLSEGRVLACRINPQSPITLRVIGKMKASFGRGCKTTPPELS